RGLSAQRIYQDLKIEVLFSGSYESVKRFVRRLRKADPARVWRIEVAAGEEAQVDFGLGAPLLAGKGRKQRTWIFRIVLSYSRKSTSSADSQLERIRRLHPHTKTMNNSLTQ